MRGLLLWDCGWTYEISIAEMGDGREGVRLKYS
jgi:hypothetical protein